MRLLSVNPFVALVIAPLSTIAALCGGPVPEAEVCNDAVDNDLDGFIDCADSDCVGGKEMLISEIQYDPTKANDVDGEYVELYNYSTSLCADISGWTIIDDSGVSPTVFLSGSVVAPGDWFVIAGSLDTAKNGNVPADAETTVDWTLNNDKCDAVTLKDSFGNVIQKVSFCPLGMNGWPNCGAGVALEYCNYSSPSGTNTATNWKCALDLYNEKDKGSPSESNTGCFF